MNRRIVLAVLLGLPAAAAWVVGIGTGARAWILTADDRGIVAHATAFGRGAQVWFVLGAILTVGGFLVLQLQALLDLLAPPAPAEPGPEVGGEEVVDGDEAPAAAALAAPDDETLPGLAPPGELVGGEAPADEAAVGDEPHPAAGGDEAEPAPPASDRP